MNINLHLLRDKLALQELVSIYHSVSVCAQLAPHHESQLSAVGKFQPEQECGANSHGPSPHFLLFY